MKNSVGEAFATGLGIFLGLTLLIGMIWGTFLVWQVLCTLIIPLLSTDSTLAIASARLFAFVGLLRLALGGFTVKTK